MYLVHLETEDILRGLSLDKIVSDMKLAAGLIYLAYNAANSFRTTTASISSRQYALQRIVNKSYITMGYFKSKSQGILTQITTAFGQIFDLKEHNAVETLERCAHSALEMANDCDELVQSITTLKDHVTTDIGTVENKIADETALLEDLEESKNKLDANLAQQQSIQDSLKKNLAKLKDMIADETAREEKESDREFGIAIAKAITNALCSGLGGFSSGLNSGGGQGSDESSQTPDIPTVPTETTNGNDEEKDNPTLDAAKKTVADLQSSKESKQKVVDYDKEQLESAENAVATAPTPDIKEGAQQTVEDWQQRLNAATEALKTVEGKLEKAQQDLDKLKSGENDSSAAKTPGTALITGSLNVRVTMINEKRKEEEAQREGMRQIGELNAQLGINKSNQEIARTAILSLQIAAWAMIRMVLALQTARMFWEDLSTYCKDLGRGQIAILVNEEMKLPAKTRLRYYHTQLFQQNAIETLVKWKAFEEVCSTYEENANLVRMTVNDNVSKALDSAAALEQLPSQKQDITEMLNKQEKASRDYEQKLEKLKDRLNALIQHSGK